MEFLWIIAFLIPIAAGYVFGAFLCEAKRAGQLKLVAAYEFALVLYSVLASWFFQFGLSVIFWFFATSNFFFVLGYLEHRFRKRDPA